MSAARSSGAQERRRRRRPPAVETLRALPHPGGPELVVEDAVDVGVVLREIAGGVLEVPEEVRADVVAAEAPDVALGIGLEHGGGAAADLVDVVDLPRGVVQEVDRGLLDEHVVVVGGAAHERREAGDGVADLEAQALGEEPLAGLLVDRADHHVPELPGADRVLAQDAVGAGARAIDASGTVVDRCRNDRLRHAGGHRHRDAHGGAGVDGGHAAVAAFGLEPEAGHGHGDAVDVVGIVGADPQFEQPAPRGVGDPQLLTTVDGVEAVRPAAGLTRGRGLLAVDARQLGRVGGQAELGVVVRGLLDVRDAEGDGGQAVQGHVRPFRPVRRRRSGGGARRGRRWWCAARRRRRGTAEGCGLRRRQRASR